MAEVDKEFKFIKKGKYDVSNKIFLDLVFNNNCNYSCPFCIARTNTYSEDNYDKWKSSFSKTIDIFGNEIDSLIILGGEATIDKRFFDRLSFIDEVTSGKHIFTILTTNGYKLQSDSFLDKVGNSSIDSFNISMMNHDPLKNKLLMGDTIDIDSLKRIYEVIKEYGKTLRLNTNVAKNNLNSLKEIEDYIRFFKGCQDAIKFTPLMETDMFDTVSGVLKYTKEKALSKEEIKVLFDSLARKYKSSKHNDKVFGLINYGEVDALGSHIILKYEQVEDMYDLGRVIPTLKLYPNGNLSNEWNHRKNILDDFSSNKVYEFKSR